MNMFQNRENAGRHKAVLYAGVMSLLLIGLLLFWYIKYDRVRTLRASLGEVEGEPLSFSADSGFYEESFVLRLEAEQHIPDQADIEIRYTVNGDDPTAGSTLYTDGIDLGEVIRQRQAQEAEEAEVIAAARQEAAAAAAREEKEAGSGQTNSSGSDESAEEKIDSAEEYSIENQRLLWEKEYYTATSGGGIYVDRAQDGIYVIPVRARLIQGEDSSAVVTRTFVVGPGVFERYDGYVACISTDRANLFDYDKGILIRGSHYQKDLDAGKRMDRSGNFYHEGEEWTKDCHLTLFSPQGRVLIEKDTGVRVGGFSSRTLPAKSLCVESPTAGWESEGWFDLDIFAGASYSRADNLQKTEGRAVKTAKVATIDIPEDPESFRRIRLRTHGVPTYHIRSVRNEYAKIITDASGFPGIAGSRLGLVFLNGSFYTDCDLSPSVTKEYICSLFGLGTADAIEKYDDGDYDVYTNAKIVRLFECDLTQEENRRALEAAVDMDNYLFYFALEVLLNNSDWPFNNVTMWRYMGAQDPDNPYTDGRFRFLLDDMDQILSNDLHSRPDQWSTELIDYLMRDEKNTFCRVMQCKKYRDTFLTYIDDLLQTSFEPDYACGILDALYADLEREYILDYGQAFWTEMEDTAEKTKNNVREKESLYRADIAKYMGLEDRYHVTIEAGEGLSVSWNNMIVNPGGIWSNEYYRGTSFAVKALPEEGRRFAGWEIVDPVSGEVTTIPQEAGQEEGILVISDALAGAGAAEEGAQGTPADSGADTEHGKELTVTVRAVAEPLP